MAGKGRDGEKDRDQLRSQMLADRKTYDQIATAMVEEFQDRRRVAWRNAHGWTQEHVADQFNCFVGDPNRSMTGQRISDFERWPLTEGRKPVPETLAILAELYGTNLLELVDDHDLQNMTLKEQAALAALKKQLSASISDNARRSTLSLAYAASMGPQQLPNTTPYFVGRTRELDMLTTQLDNAVAEDRPVVITAIGGTAGIGKTALALYWTQTHIDRFSDGQLYVNLRGFHPSGTPMAPQEAIRGFLDAFNTPVEQIPTSLDAQAALYRKIVEGKRLVIVLDNARDTDQVRPLLPGSPTCTVLITSRQHLSSLTNESEGATCITLGYLTTAEARQLLIKILGSERIDAEPDAVDELIQRCVHLPTALHIAAARIKAEPHTSLTALVGQLREQRQRLAALSTGDSQYFDIRAVFSWSYTALTTGAARLFRLLGLHPGPDISTLAAASLAGLPEHATSELLTSLTRAYLLEEPTPGRYQFHDLLRIYATEQAAKKEFDHQRQLAIRRVLDYYLHTSIAANQRLNPHRVPIAVETMQPGVIPNQVANHKEASEWFTTEHDILLAVTNLAARSGLYAHAWQLPWALATFLHRWGHWHDYAATQHTALVAAADHLGDRAAQALALRLLGHAYTHLERYADALTYLQQALIQYQHLDDRDGQARTHLSLGMACERQNQYAEALTHAKQAFNLYRTTDNRIWQARALNNVGWYHALLGLYQETIVHCQQALTLHHELGDRMGIANTLDSLGYADYHLGRHDHALTCYQQSITSWQELGHYYHEARSLARLGDTHHATGNYSAARNTWQHALDILDRLGHPDAKHLRIKLTKFQIDLNCWR